MTLATNAALELRVLTARQREVLELVARGLPDKEIALRLKISERSVRFHVHQSVTRVGGRSRAQAVAIAIRAGLLVE